MLCNCDPNMPSETLFPLLSSNGQAPSYRDVLSIYRRVLSARIEEGTLRPLVLPYHLYGYLILIVYLCIPHKNKPWVYALRWPVLLVVCSFQWKTIQETSSWNGAAAYAGGLVAALGIVWAFIWLVLYQPQWDAQRVERRTKHGSDTIPKVAYGDTEELLDKRSKCRQAVPEYGFQEKYVKGGHSPQHIDQEDKLPRKRRAVGGEPYGGVTYGSPISNGDLINSNVAAVAVATDLTNQYEYFWQPYPDNILERTDWVWDLLANFRGPGWNWEITPMPGQPLFIQQELGGPSGENFSSGKSSVGFRQFTSKHKLFDRQVPKFVAGYFVLDTLKILMMKDPYFIFGPNSYALPSHIAGLSTIQLKVYRLIISFLAITISLEMALILSPIGLGLVLGNSILGLRGEPWYYVTHWGSPSTIGTKGLNGLWGSWWHQTFRFAFAAPTNYLIDNQYIQPRSSSTKIVGLVFAFGISGFLHSCASMTQFPKTSAINPMIFFMLQAVGIFIQSTACSLLSRYTERLPSWLRKGGNVLYAFGWLIMTAGWLTDDFARGGVWLYEPIPLSPLRGLGFGQFGDGWWCWDEYFIRWHKGKHWWESGLAI